MSSARKFSLILAAIASTLSAVSVSRAFGASPAVLDRVYFFLSKTQDADGGIGPEIRRTDDQALVAAVFLNRGHINRARRALDLLERIRRADEKRGGFKGFARTYDDGLKPVSEHIDPFTQAAVAAAIHNYRITAGSKRYDGAIRALAGLYVGRINAWGVVTDFALSPSTAASASSRPSEPSADENLCAYYILSAAASATGDETYLKAAKRLRFALNDLFFDAARKSFAARLGDLPSGDTFADILGALFAGPWRPSVALDATGDISRMALSELAVMSLSAEPSPTEQEPATAMFISFPPGIPDGAFIGSRAPAQSGAEYYQTARPDYSATAIYAFISEKINPFALRDENFERRMEGAAAERGQKWKSDSFDAGEREFYFVPRDGARGADVFLGLDEQIKKDGRFSLRAQYAPSKNEKSAAAVSRTFYPSQDFSASGRIRFWLAARPAAFSLGSAGLKARMRLADESGAWADSGFLNYSGRGVENSLVCPSGFAPPAGGRSPDYSKIKRIVWMFEEDTQTSWNINVDDVRIE